MTENKFNIGDKVVHGEELLMIVNGEKAKKFIYELTAVGMYHSLALNKENHEVMLDLEKIRLLNEKDLDFLNNEELI